MSREIKFRAFDTLEKKYMYYTLEKGIVSVTSEFNSLDSNRLHDEQYTGLKDKNGVEIYEGDIVQTAFEQISSISFYRNSFHLDFFPKFNSDGLLGNWVGGNLEVIGNLHENPELLDKQGG